MKIKYTHNENGEYQPGLEKFLTHYIAAALWSSTDDDGEPLDATYSVSDITPGALQRMREDCYKWLCENPIPEYNHSLYSDTELAGHDFWLTRNRHGAGFWDRGLGELGERLADAARAFGECGLYVGDDGVIYAH